MACQEDKLVFNMCILININVWYNYYIYDSNKKVDSYNFIKGCVEILVCESVLKDGQILDKMEVFIFSRVENEIKF